VREGGREGGGEGGRKGGREKGKVRVVLHLCEEKKGKGA
jgi:hypothetical protein